MSANLPLAQSLAICADRPGRSGMLKTQACSEHQHACASRLSMLLTLTPPRKLHTLFCTDIFHFQGFEFLEIVYRNLSRYVNQQLSFEFISKSAVTMALIQQKIEGLDKGRPEWSWHLQTAVMATMMFQRHKNFWNPIWIKLLGYVRQN